MPVASLVVRTVVEREDEVAEAINAMDGAQASRVDSEPATLIVITETSSKRQDSELWEHINVVPGVVSVGLAYHNLEDIVEGDA